MSLVESCFSVVPAVPVAGAGGGSGSVVSGSGGSDANEGLDTATQCAESGSHNNGDPTDSVVAFDFELWDNGSETGTPTRLPATGYHVDQLPDITRTNLTPAAMYCGDTRFAFNAAAPLNSKFAGAARLSFTMDDDYWVYMVSGRGTNTQARMDAFALRRGGSCTVTISVSTPNFDQTLECSGHKISSSRYASNAVGSALRLSKENPTPNIPDVTLSYDPNGGSSETAISQRVPGRLPVHWFFRSCPLFLWWVLVVVLVRWCLVRVVRIRMRASSRPRSAPRRDSPNSDTSRRPRPWTSTTATATTPGR